ncbi:MAG TPA: glycosyltransferase [Gammaproteobacteria bacterium]|nr:glycosyltransferase [Gammaproteobacteria bacterium]
MDVSIIVPFHNEEKHIEESVQTLLKLDYDKDLYEILMINNNSTDRSVEIVSAYPGVRLLDEKKPGDFAARNLGVAEARGRILAFTDSDTAPDPDWLQQIVQAMENPGTAVVVGSLRFSSESLGMALLCDYEAEKNRFIFTSDDPHIYYGYTCNMAVRRSVFEELGPFPEVYRNSDAVFVRKVVDRFSVNAVSYGEQMSVRRLEVASIWDYFMKAHVYGRDLNRYSLIAEARPLRTAERLAVFRRALRHYRYPVFTALYLILLLVTGVISYDSGKLRGLRF